MRSSLAIQGPTYPFKDYLKDKGFTFHATVNNMEGINVWLADQEAIDSDEIKHYMEEFGFSVSEFDGAEDEVAAAE